MFWKKEKQVVDERIQKESNKLTAKLYYVVVVLTIISMVVKIACKFPVYVYGLEIIALVTSLAYFFVNEIGKGILFLKNKDEELLNLHNSILTKAYMIVFWILIVGELFYFILIREHVEWVLSALSYVAIWFVPALIQTIASIKNGWFIWGSKKKEVKGKKDFKKRVVYGSLFYGLFVGFPFLYKDGAFHPEGILWVLGLAVGWGIPFYFIMMLLMKVAEKKADEKLEEQVEEVEE